MLTIQRKENGYRYAIVRVGSFSFQSMRYGDWRRSLDWKGWRRALQFEPDCVTVNFPRGYWAFYVPWLAERLYVRASRRHAKRMGIL